MAKENDAAKMNDAATKTEPKEEQKTEPKKEFFLIRGIKAIGRGCKKVGTTVNGFMHKHPYLGAGISTAIGWGAKTAWDYFTDSSSSDAPNPEVPALPEPEDTYIELPEEDYTEEEEKLNEE